VIAKRKIANAIKLFPLALPFLSVDLKGISAIFIINSQGIIYHLLYLSYLINIKTLFQ